MRKINLLCCLMLLAGISASGVALAESHGHGGGHGNWHGGSHVGLGFYIGAPYLYPYYSPYYYPYGYYPPAVVVPAQPQVYIEQPTPQVAPPQAPAPQANSYWYHCENPEGYYPYIKECPGGWKAVAPTPPPQQ